MSRSFSTKQRALGHSAEATMFGSPNSRLALLGGALACALAAFTYAPSAQAAEPCPNEAIREQQHATFLPNCRAYEQVSPVAKQGADVIGDSLMTRAAADGNALAFASLGAFGDAIGTGLSTEYIAERSSTGWFSHAITPRQEPLSISALTQGAVPYYRGDFSPDLSSGVYGTPSALTSDPGVADAYNFYTRDDLRSPGAGSYSLATACPLCAATEPLPPLASSDEEPKFAGASADSSHVLFESTSSLTADTPQPSACATNSSSCLPHLYKSDHGEVTLAGRVPGSGIECDDVSGPACVAADISIAGVGAGASSANFYTPHVISADGKRVIFTQVTAAQDKAGQIFERIDSEKTIQINASERTDCAISAPGEAPKVPPACTGAPAPAPSAAATYQDATPDGTRVFFTSPQSLTDDAPPGGQDKLYLWDATKPAGQRLTFVSRADQGAEEGSVSPGRAGIIGTSEDGASVYFAATGSLVAGSSSPGLYLWRQAGGNSTLRYVGRLAHLARAGTPDLAYLTWLNNWKIALGKESRVSPDGRYLLFMSSSGEGLLSAHGGADVSQGDNAELYLYDAQTESLACATCPDSTSPLHGALDVITGISQGSASDSPHLNHPLADDGRYVFFSTEEPLVPEDTNGAYDAYSYDSQTGEVHLLSSGTDEKGSYFLEASPDGRDAFFLTRARLVGQDTDSSYDVYDARVEGGIPAQSPPPGLAQCEGEACHPPAKAPPVAPSAATPRFEGPANPEPKRPAPCKKTQVRKHGKCVKKKSAKKSHHRAARINSGGAK